MLFRLCHRFPRWYVTLKLLSKDRDLHHLFETVDILISSFFKHVIHINYEGTNDFPTCTMNDKTIIISNPNKEKVGGIQIKENTAKRRMKFTINDLAYTCDIEALHKKIDTLHEQTEANTVSLTSTLNEFPTIDEVNEALEKVKNDCDSKFVLKTQISELQNRITTLESELSKYRKVDDITYARNTLLSITNKINQFGDDTNKYTSHRVMTAHVSYHEYAHLIGVIHELSDINISFDVVFKYAYTDLVDCDDGTAHQMYVMELDINYTPFNVILNDAQYELCWDSVTGAVFTFSLNHPDEEYVGITVELTYAAIETSSNFVTTPTHDNILNYTTPWIGFYNDFNRYVDENDIKYHYSADAHKLTINFSWLDNKSRHFVFMLHDKHNRQHSIRLYKSFE